MRTGYAGSCIRVRRSSDNTEQDIGFDASGNLNLSALTTFVGANSGFVVVWYDQSGNVRNATQGTAANQPQIIDTGGLQTVQGKPSIFFSTNRRLTYTNNASQPITVSIVERTTSSVTNAHLTDGLNASTDRILVSMQDGGYSMYAGVGIATANSAYPFSNTYILTSLFNLTQSQGYVNGNLAVSGNVGTFNMTSQSLGAGTSGNVSINGWISETIGFNSLLSSTDRLVLERTQGAYFGITVA